MGNEAYQAYLQSPEWKVRRARCLQRAERRCEVCRGVAEEVHHLTYERVGNEDPNDLLAVCGKCHEMLTGLEPPLGMCLGEPEYDPRCTCPQCRYDREMGDAEETARKRYGQRMDAMFLARREADAMADAMAQALDKRGPDRAGG